MSVSLRFAVFALACLGCVTTPEPPRPERRLHVLGVATWPSDAFDLEFALRAAAAQRGWVVTPDEFADPQRTTCDASRLGADHAPDTVFACIELVRAQWQAMQDARVVWAQVVASAWRDGRPIVTHGMFTGRDVTRAGSTPFVPESFALQRAFAGFLDELESLESAPRPVRQQEPDAR